MWTTLNVDQIAATEAIWNAVSDRNDQLFFLNNYNNIDKTMLQNTVLRRVRNEFKMTIAVISSDIVVILLQGERIAYSRFKIFLNVTAQSSCAMSKTFDLAELFLTIELIF